MFKWCLPLLMVLGDQPSQVLHVWLDHDCALNIMTVPLASMKTATESGLQNHVSMGLNFQGQ